MTPSDPTEVVPTKARYRVTVVIPCFNEAERLDRGALEGFLGARPDVAFLLVNDGSTDRTLEVLTALEDAWVPRVRVLDLGRNRGKGEAVRAGMLEALATSTTYAAYWDADLATPLEAIDAFADTMDRTPELDLVLGARVALLGRTIERKAARHYLGRVFATAASLTLGLAVYDTQCGAKMFRAGRGLESLFRMPFGSRWIFDVEILARYLETRDVRGLHELPLKTWRDVGASKVQPADFVRAMRELLRVYRRYPHLRRLQPGGAEGTNPRRLR